MATAHIIDLACDDKFSASEVQDALDEMSDLKNFPLVKQMLFDRFTKPVNPKKFVDDEAELSGSEYSDSEEEEIRELEKEELTKHSDFIVPDEEVEEGDELTCYQDIPAESEWRDCVEEEEQVPKSPDYCTQEDADSESEEDQPEEQPVEEYSRKKRKSEKRTIPGCKRLKKNLAVCHYCRKTLNNPSKVDKETGFAFCNNRCLNLWLLK